MDLGLRDKSVLVTGGSRGIGLAIARAFHHELARVVICSRRPRHLVEAARSIGEIVAVPCDITKPEDVRAMLRRAGPLDVLVNNAGGMLHFRDAEGTTAEDWRRTFDLNLFSAVELTRAALPALRRRKGVIINIASEVGRQPFAMGPDYCAAKAALLSWSKSLSSALAPEGVRVVSVCPGPVVTDSWTAEARKRGGRAWRRALAKAVQGAAARVPMGRTGTPEDVAGLVAFLASPRAGWITGSAFAVDGGAVRVIS